MTSIKRVTLDDDYIPRPREIATAPKFGYYFCDHCDRALLNDGGRCPICNHKNGRYRLKKWKFNK